VVANPIAGYNGGYIFTNPGQNGVPAESYWASGDAYFANPSGPGTIAAPFIAGTATSAATIAAMGNVSANYIGGTLLGIGARSVSVNVNFGTATWTGNFSNGYSSQTAYTLTSGGNFSAAGTISGANLNGTASGIGVASGSVTANFVGPAAQGMIGNYNVNFNKAVNYGGGVVNMKDAFWAAKVTGSRN
jgi:hypothetical protein